MGQSFAHCYVLNLLVGYARISRTVSFLDLFVRYTRISLTVSSVVLLVCYPRISRTVSSLGVFVSYTRILRTVSSRICWFFAQESCAFFLLKFASLLRENLAHSFFPWVVGLLCKNRAPCFVLICWFVTQECRALFLLQIACLLRENLAHSFSRSLLFCYTRTSPTVSSLVLFLCCARTLCIVSSVVCQSVTQEPRALFVLVCWFVMQ